MTKVSEHLRNMKKIDAVKEGGNDALEGNKSEN